MRKVLIDTNVYTAFKRNDRRIVHAFRHCDFIGIDVAVLAELYYGFRCGEKEKENHQELEDFINNPRVDILIHTQDTAAFFSKIIEHLRKKGKPIPTNDIWIAATAMQHGLALFTLDKHFSAVDGLMLKTDF